MSDLYNMEINPDEKSTTGDGDSCTSDKYKSIKSPFKAGGDGDTTNTSNRETAKGPSYQFRGLIVYYGKHYLSIFQDQSSYSEQSQNFLLFDDSHIRQLGNDM